MSWIIPHAHDTNNFRSQ